MIEVDRKNIDLTGQRFGRLVAVEKASYTDETGTEHCIYKHLCRCDCGNLLLVDNYHLVHNNTKSCGCLKKEIAIQNIGYVFFEKTNVKLISKKEANINSHSKIRGVFWNKKRKLWHAQLKLKGEVAYSEFFKSKQDAINARKEAEVKYFKPTLGKYNQK